MGDDVAEGFASGTRARAGGVAGDVSAGRNFDELFLDHYGRLVAVLYRLLGDRGRAEDLVSEAFLKLYPKPLPLSS